ncbi:prolyl aminopeptidase [Neisseria meningitidis]|uniref:prolyl aminopeptidase n=1 Tax=Neisseria meningitidis TaxID=487 RepID=UPI00027C9417|nr:prolyl aminopeptidase [Neisseria meningitidis]EJU55155.1 prolyl aminopeptidase [Neisseria meningitidis 93003]EJU80358.1 prolyl aminopeptidase [Neisseria meningitidis NM3081]ELL31864.1 prolyl aminopeptidase [Neisseria meningitidis 77221]MBW3871923.1 prolyl aminopeptidase [Neisseria meningitidis]MBW3886340.1 prolyl aminopeptidase [Neisseria meningitidis]
MYEIKQPFHSGYLQVSEIHQIYWEESGNPDGVPVIFLHGGPGAGASPECRGFFNPDVFRIVIIDQRGCGRSRPYACAEDNTTWDLVADIEKVREMLGIGKWLVFGGSWGSTLSLAYAQTHPEQVKGLVLRGIFLCRPSETAWLNEAGGVSRIYPEQWQKFVAPIAENRRNRLIEAYHGLLFHQDEEVCLSAAKAWADWESYLIRFEPEEVDEDAYASLAIARLENHYFVNGGWLQGDRAILNNIGKIRHIPTIIVQGRYDLCTPMQSAWALSKAFPEAELRVVQAGHRAFDPPLADALVQAVEDILPHLL